MYRRKASFLISILCAAVVFVLVVPVVSRSGIPLCSLQSVSAQGNPCLEQEVTISAQELRILQLQGTINAHELQNLQLSGTLGSVKDILETPPVLIVITVPVIITATPNSHQQTAAASVTPTFFIFPTTTPSPTALDMQVEIVRVVNADDINGEGVDIRNNGAVIDLTGWELIDNNDNTYIFPQQRLFQGSVLTVYTRIGTDTPTAKFWGRNSALWSSGSTLTLRDNRGQIQSIFEVP